MISFVRVISLKHELKADIWPIFTYKSGQAVSILFFRLVELA